MSLHKTVILWSAVHTQHSFRALVGLWFIYCAKCMLVAHNNNYAVVAVCEEELYHVLVGMSGLQ